MQGTHEGLQQTVWVVYTHTQTHSKLKRFLPVSCNSTQLTWTWNKTQSDSALVPGPKAFHWCSAFISQRGSSRWGNQTHSVSQWQQTGQPSCLLLQLVKFICQFFESGLGSSTSTQLGHKEGGKAGGVCFLDCRKLPYCCFWKKKEKSRCILGNPWLPMWESRAHAQPVSHGGENTYDTRSLGSGRWRNNSKIRNDRLLQGKWESLVRNVSRNDRRTDGQMVNVPVSLKGNREVKDRVCVSGGMNSAWQWVYDEFTNMQVRRRYEVWVCVCVSMYAAVWSMRDLFRVEWPRVQIRS